MPAVRRLPNHGGECLDADGYVLPVYAALAAEWAACGRSLLSEEELSDLDETLVELEDEHRGR